MKIQNLLFCVRKDITEYYKTRRSILFGATVLGMCAMVFVSTLYLPALLNMLLERSDGIIASSDKLSDTLLTFFPQDLKSNMGVLASDLIIFFGMVAILTTYNLNHKERQMGRWIFPINAGYTPFDLIFSKGLVYGIGAAVLCCVFYNMYNVIGRLYLISNYDMRYAVLNSLILGYIMFLIVYTTVVTASVSKHALTIALTVITTVLFLPDILSLFTFGRYLPTHLLTYVYQSGENLMEVIIPWIGSTLLLVLMTVMSLRKTRSLNLMER